MITANDDSLDISCIKMMAFVNYIYLETFKAKLYPEACPIIKISNK